MLIKAKTLKGYSLKSLDGHIGSVSEFYFDDRFWVIRYLVANTGNWLTGRKVLISPYSLREIDIDKKEVNVHLTKQQITDCPALDSDKPVSLQYESLYNDYYGFPNYWGGPYMWGGDPYLELDRSRWGLAAIEATEWDRHLRSSYEVTGYHLEAVDGEIGHVDDFILDSMWSIQYLVAATTNWWPGKKVLISPRWVRSVSWDERQVEVGLSSAHIKDAPEYTDQTFITRDYETSLYGHYNREGYWVDELTTI